MALTQFSDYGNPVDATWFNNVDAMVQTALGGVPTVASVRTTLGITAGGVPPFPLSIANGGTSAATAAAALSALGGLQVVPQTAAELAVAFAPSVAQQQYQPGDLRRYGCDPTGVADSAAAMQIALSCNALVFDDYPGGGLYILASEVSITNYPLTIMGQAKDVALNSKGTRFQLQTSAGSGKAILHFTGFINDVHIERINFQWQTQVAGGQYGILSTSQFRSSSIVDCGFFGGLACTGTGISLQCPTGGGNFSGGVTVRDCYFANMYNGYTQTGPCTTIKILNNEFYGLAGVSNSGIQIGSPPSTGNDPGQGVLLIGNTLENWNIGILSYASATRQFSNYFENNATVAWRWYAGGSYPATVCSSFGDTITNGTAPVAGTDYLYNNSAGNLVVSSGFGYYVDAGIVNIYRGVATQGLTTADGIYTDYTPACAAGSGTWSPTVTYAYYSRKNGELTVHFSCTGTLSGSATNVLTIALPASLTANKATSIAASVTNNGATAFGLAYVTAGGGLINIGLGANGSGNFTNGTVAAIGQITLRILS